MVSTSVLVCARNAIVTMSGGTVSVYKHTAYSNFTIEKLHLLTIGKCSQLHMLAELVFININYAHSMINVVINVPENHLHNNF